MRAVMPAMTVEQFLALPDAGMDRELIRGELRERPLTVHTRLHSATAAALSCGLRNWLKGSPMPRGKVYCGVGCILLRDPATVVGIDIAYVSHHGLQQRPGNSTLLEGPPVLAVEILSPSDVHADVIEKVRLYLEADTALVWIVDPDLQTLTVYRNDADHQFYSRQQMIAEDVHLPGLSIPVSELFQ